MNSAERIALSGVGASLLLAALMGCPAATPQEMTMEEPPSADALFRLITETDPFQDWAQFPNAQGLVESAAPHGPMARTYLNGTVEDAMNDFSGSLPDGSVIIKENLGESTSEKADAWTVMWKVRDYDADNNDWFWVNMTPDGEVLAEGRVDGCINCHGGARANDFVLIHEF